ncbi:MAG: phenylalanine--tRNA ligase subunit beta [Rickettsiales bacterium]|jgi:phenylalanyl-tRNA synthetase beta chain|nr:phenylalanine--tRNA ligase subunit beta [Rickettsiales bacterium]
MKFTLSSLKRYLETDASAAKIQDALTMLGLEIEDIKDASAALGGFVVGEIVECAPHPDSVRLHCLKVNSGDEILNVVCGAPNARKGLKGILARPGDKIPSTGEKLKAGRIRGAASDGMMCSEAELNLGPGGDGIIELDSSAAAGMPAAGALAGKYGLEVLYDAEITPNRPDCLGVVGIARDLAAGGFGRFKAPEIPEVAPGFQSAIKVVNQAKDIARHFVMLHIRDVDNRQGPPWLARYLRAVGCRSINPLVDITNYCLYEFCRPLHVFDADRIKGPLTVRRAKKGERFEALDGNVYSLDETDAVIADDNGVQSLAGIMGGLASGCGEGTRNVLLESAYFDPGAIRRTAKRLGLESDSKYRFERGIDPGSTMWGLKIAAGLIVKACGGQVSQIIQTGENPYVPREIAFPARLFEQRIGVDMPAGRMRGIMEGLGCQVSGSDEVLKITPPSWRGDLAIAEDITEELARIYGYDRLPSVSVVKDGLKATLAPSQARRQRLVRALAATGLSETYTYSFMDGAKSFGASGVSLSNPIASTLGAMRASIVPNLLSAAAYNRAQSVSSVAVFEVGPVFSERKGPDGEPSQEEAAAALLCGPRADGAWQDKGAYSLYDAKAALARALEIYGVSLDRLPLEKTGLPEWVNPSAGGRVMMGRRQVALFGQIHPSHAAGFGLKADAFFFELRLDMLPAPKSGKSAKKALAVSPFPASHREFSMLFGPDVGAGQVKDAVMKEKNPLILSASVFDVYKDARLGGKRAIGIRLAIGAMDRTLSEAEIAAAFDKAVAAAARLGGELRS